MAAVTFPVALHLKDRRCLVVGSGDDAAQRAEHLLAAGALVRVVAPEPTTAVDVTRKDPRLELVRRAFDESDLDDVWLVIQTERDPELAARIGSACEARRIFFCATDDPTHNGFSHMAIARAGFVKLAISTDGRAPALGRRLRQELERVFDAAGLAEFAAKLSELRTRTPSSLRSRVLGDAVRELRLDGSLVIPKI